MRDKLKGENRGESEVTRECERGMLEGGRGMKRGEEGEGWRTGKTSKKDKRIKGGENEMR